MTLLSACVSICVCPSLYVSHYNFCRLLKLSISPSCLCVCVSRPNFLVFYAVNVLSKKSRRLVLPRTTF
jgi:hypothetical protein